MSDTLPVKPPPLPPLDVLRPDNAPHRFADGGIQALVDAQLAKVPPGEGVGVVGTGRYTRDGDVTRYELAGAVRINGEWSVAGVFQHTKDVHGSSTAVQGEIVWHPGK